MLLKGFLDPDSASSSSTNQHEAEGCVCCRWCEMNRLLKQRSPVVKAWPLVHNKMPGSSPSAIQHTALPQPLLPQKSLCIDQSDKTTNVNILLIINDTLKLFYMLSALTNSLNVDGIMSTAWRAAVRVGAKTLKVLRILWMCRNPVGDWVNGDGAKKVNCQAGVPLLKVSSLVCWIVGMFLLGLSMWTEEQCDVSQQDAQ